MRNIFNNKSPHLTRNGSIRPIITANRRNLRTTSSGMNRKSIYILFLVLTGLMATSCKKILSVPSPTSQVTVEEIFNNDKTANGAMAGVYTNLITGPFQGRARDLFAAGLTPYTAGLSSDELVVLVPNTTTVSSLYDYNSNRIKAGGTDVGGTVTSNSQFSDPLWTSAYSAIFGANAIIKGIKASTSPALHDSVRNELTAEAKGVRAFCYFYLTNFYGDVPLTLSAEPILDLGMSRTPQAEVYQQIITDLKDAQAGLPSDYSVGRGERIRFNKWAATALLARVYLYTGDYANAAIMASEVIDHASLFNLSDDLKTVFLANSREAIWQLQQNVNNQYTGNAVPEVYYSTPITAQTGTLPISLSPQLLNAFEQGDKRRISWIDSTVFSLDGVNTLKSYFPVKYKTGMYNRVFGGTATEYYMVLRIAEQYLIRAEAGANGAGGGASAAIADLNLLRNRAGLQPLPATLSQTDLIAAIAHEWQTEFFYEWGHRWFNLKRTEKAHQVLSQIPIKQPWAGDYQLLYPIPFSNILYGPKLTQNPGY